MHSPDKITFAQFIQLNKKDTSTPIYLQLVNEMMKAIHLGNLPHQTKLPGTRQLEKVFGVNRNTIIKAFQELEAQNYIQILPNKGTYIYFPHQTNIKFNQKNIISDKAGFHFNTSRFFDHKKNKEALYNLNTPTLDTRLIDLSLTNRLEHQFKFKNIQEDELNTTITNYLRITKGIRLKEDQIVGINGYKTSLHLLAQLLKDEHPSIAVAEKNEPAVNAIFQHYGWKIIPIKMDEFGIIPEELEKAILKTHVKRVYIQTNFSYPTTISLTTHRQNEILHIISKYKGVIIEDDVLGEYNYSSLPMHLLVQKSFENHIIYITQLGKHLRSIYHQTLILGPSNFIKEITNQKYYISDNHLDNSFVLNYILKEGLYTKSLKKIKKELRDRRDYLGNLLLLHFGNDIDFKLPKGGFHYWITFNLPIHLPKLQKDALDMGLSIASECIYQSKNEAHLIFPFSSYTTQELEKIVEIIKRSILKQV